MTTETLETREEQRDKNVTVMVTPSEKRAVQLIAALRDTTESEVVRNHSIEQIVAEAEEVRRSRESAGTAA